MSGIPYRPVLDLPLLTNENRLILFDQLNHDKFFFVQIGAYDGITHDPLFELIDKYNWAGVLLEPQQGGVWERLQKNHRKHKKLILINAALHDKVGEKEIYHHGSETSFIDRKTLSEDWKKETLATLKKAPLVKVNTVSWESLNIKKLDFLHTDTEGMDYKIIKTVLQSGIVPKVIQFESNIFYTINESKEIFNYLRNFGYVLFHNKYKYAVYDCLAIQESFYV